MTVNLTSHAEALLKAEIARGGQSPEAIVERALETLAGLSTVAEAQESITAAEAIDDLFAVRRDVTLGGLRVKDLVEEGRKY